MTSKQKELRHVCQRRTPDWQICEEIAQWHATTQMNEMLDRLERRRSDNYFHIAKIDPDAAVKADKDYLWKKAIEAERQKLREGE